MWRGTCIVQQAKAGCDKSALASTSTSTSTRTSTSTSTVATAALTMLAVLCVGLVRSATVRRLGSAAVLRILQVVQARLDHPPPRRRRKLSRARRCRLPSTAVQQTQATVSTQDAATVPQLAHQTPRWIWLNVQQMRAAMTLGYTELGWDLGITPAQISGSSWHQLTGHLQAAARILDYTLTDSGMKNLIKRFLMRRLLCKLT